MLARAIMKTTIRLTKSEESKALPILYRHFSGMILPERVYVLDDSAVAALREAGVRFEELAAEGNAPKLTGALDGERV
jgi:hypothetical protein